MKKAVFIMNAIGNWCGKNITLFFNNMDVVECENSNDEDMEQKDVGAKRLEKNNIEQKIKGVITSSNNNEYWGVKCEESGKFHKLGRQEKTDWEGGEKVQFILKGHFAVHVELRETD